MLGGTALPTDFTNPDALAFTVKTLPNDPGARAELRTADLANARHFPISTTAKALTHLGNEIA
ncbi:hypothetical protein [Nonomuraea basaltis]|uniref:hypothetical protein n=1 Tax=Nonomuraea basaltis TaxID=2495887 RepID=UPI00110C5BAD|nr:hypothetical protein [Nonomuraea basaltis]TMR98393.1 hypothetical protein EJK15_12570 [Nonomuraea basaltis]